MGLSSRIMDALKEKKDTVLIEEFNFKDKHNELLFFFKPECFMVEECYIQKIVEMVISKLLEKVEISGVLLLDGKVLEELNIMSTHYGFINRLSNFASKLLKKEDYSIIGQKLSLPSLDYICLGGHEFLKKYTNFTPSSLDLLWREKKSIKIRSGFYVEKYKVGEEEIVLINGFHPLQLSHYTQSGRKVLVLLLHSDENWGKLKNQLVGDTFPENAIPTSIRGELYRNHSFYGLKEVSISFNCVHLSAGPFEAGFEIENFLKNIEETGFNIRKTNIFKKMKTRKIVEEKIRESIKNPKTIVKDKEIDLFTLTEEKDTEEAIYEYIKYFGG